MTTEGSAKVHTEHGQVLGTLGYMAPEQLRGQTIDARADLFSFGAVLYEMVSGRRAFQADSSADSINAILAKDPPDLASSPEPMPPALVRIVMRCLEKDPAARFQSSSDLAFALDAVAGASTPSGSRLEQSPAGAQSQAWNARTIAVTASVTTVVVLALGTLWNIQRQEQTAIPGVLRFALFPPEGILFGVGASARFSVSPDGTQIAFVAEAKAATSVWVQSLDSLAAREVPGTNGVLGVPFWSPDSRAIAFMADGKLKRIDANDVVARVLCDLLVFVRDGVLMAQAFDTSVNRLLGEARPIGEAARFGNNPTLSVASNILIYNTGLTPVRQFLWIDRLGKELSYVGQPAPWGNFDRSPDETQVVASRSETGVSGNRRPASTHRRPQLDQTPGRVFKGLASSFSRRERLDDDAA